MRSSLSSVIIHFALLIILVIWMIPEMYMLSISLRTPEQAFDPQLVTWPMTLSNFVTVIRDNPLLQVFSNSLLITSSTVILVVAASSAFAFACSILRLGGTMMIYTTLLTTLMVPTASIILPIAVLIRHFGWVNSYLGLIFPYVAMGVPFGIVILKAFLDDSPRELFDAARVDGCGAFQTYWHVALPLLRPALTFVAIWQFISTWNEFFLALIILTVPEMKTVTLIPMQYSGLYMANPGALFAVLILVALPLIVMYVLVQRAFVNGLLNGALKG
jgi:raffinose/stachyose/melibiose transport system permease protein